MKYEYLIKENKIKQEKAHPKISNMAKILKLE